jgi:hypothetical protein
MRIDGVTLALALSLAAAGCATRLPPETPSNLVQRTGVRGISPQLPGVRLPHALVEKPGTSLEAMRRTTVNAARELMDVDGVRNFGAHIGRAEVADEVVGINFTELWISLDPSVDYAAKVAQIQSIVDGYPGLTRDLLTYLRERIKEVLTGASATIVVRTFGPNIEQLGVAAGEVARVLAQVDGVADLTAVDPARTICQCDVSGGELRLPPVGWDDVAVQSGPRAMRAIRQQARCHDNRRGDVLAPCAVGHEGCSRCNVASDSPGGASRVARACERNMDLIALAAAFLMSLGLGLAGSRAVLSGVFFLMTRSISRDALVNIETLKEGDYGTHTFGLAAAPSA